MKNPSRTLTQVNLKLLQAFLLVGEHGSFRTAAELSCRSTSAISAQIRQLEEQLGVALFHRTTRNVRLTEEGAQLLECARRALQEVEQGLRTLQEAADARRGRVSICCSPTVAATRLARVLAAFEKDCPEIEVSVRETPSEELFASVRSREVDFGIGPAIDTQEFRFEILMDDPLIALVPRRYLETLRGGSGDSISLAALATLPLLLLSHANALREMLETTLRERGLRFSGRYEFSQAQTLISMAGAGLCAAILPRMVLPPVIDPGTVALRIVNPVMSRKMALITARGQTLSPAARRLAELLRQWMPEPSERPPAPSLVLHTTRTVARRTGLAA